MARKTRPRACAAAARAGRARTSSDGPQTTPQPRPARGGAGERAPAPAAASLRHLGPSAGPSAGGGKKARASAARPGAAAQSRRASEPSGKPKAGPAPLAPDPAHPPPAHLLPTPASHPARTRPAKPAAPRCSTRPPGRREGARGARACEAGLTGEGPRNAAKAAAAASTLSARTNAPPAPSARSAPAAPPQAPPAPLHPRTFAPKRAARSSIRQAKARSFVIPSSDAHEAAGNDPRLVGVLHSTLPLADEVGRDERGGGRSRAPPCQRGRAAALAKARLTAASSVSRPDLGLKRDEARIRHRNAQGGGINAPGQTRQDAPECGCTP